MPKEEIDAFLGATPAAEPAPAPTPAAAPPEAPPAADKATEAKPPPDDAEPPEALDGEPVIPRRAYEDERRKRQDWKEKAARAEGELAELRRQMEEAKRPQPAPPQQMPAMPPIDPSQDPQGFVQRVQSVMLNERLNNSEMFLREKIGPEKTEEYVAEFKQAAERDPTLYGKLYSQANPYGWLQKEVERMRVLRDVGDDPNSYRERLIAEERAKWEAERATPVPQQMPVSPAAGQPRSLATARSVAPRSAPQWSGPTPLNEIARRG